MAFKLIPSPRGALAAVASAVLFMMGSGLPAHAIVNGTDTTSFAAVGDVRGASGVLIADNWVLTAGHMAGNLTPNVVAFYAQGGIALVDAAYLYSDAAYPTDDIALFHLATGIDAALPVLNDQSIDAASLAGLGPLTMVSAQNSPHNGSASTVASEILDTINYGGVDARVNWIVTTGTAYIEGGDSGGALFQGDVTDSAGALLLGVTSTELLDVDGTHSSAFVQVANYKSWIDATMAASGQQAIWRSTASAQAPQGPIEAVPEPSTAALFSVAGLAAFLRLRQSRQRPLLLS